MWKKPKARTAAENALWEDGKLATSRADFEERDERIDWGCTMRNWQPSVFDDLIPSCSALIN